MKLILLLMNILLLAAICVADPLVTKIWHVSPDSDPRISTSYPFVDWSIVSRLKIGMTTEDAKALVRTLQSYHHPVNAIVFSTYEGSSYEIALKLSKDGKLIEDISYKKRH